MLEVGGWKLVIGRKTEIESRKPEDGRRRFVSAGKLNIMDF